MKFYILGQQSADTDIGPSLIDTMSA